MLKRFLDGTTQLSVVEHVSGHVAYDEEVHLGTKDTRIAVVDAAGRPLGLDKSNRITTTFDTRDTEQTKPLLDSTEQVLAALHEAGVEAFPAYGTLLGAIREQDFIGHDNDVDLGYVSRHTHPLDVIRESFRLQRTLREQGYAVDRYSAGGVQGRRRRGRRRRARARRLRRLLPRREALPDGRDRHALRGGVDLPAGHLHPRRPHAAGARPAREAPRGDVRTRRGRCPTRRSTSTTPRTTYRRLNGWFRGGRIMRNEWDRRFSTLREKMPKVQPSPLAPYVAEQEHGSARTSSTSAPAAAPTRSGSPGGACRPSGSTTRGARPTPYAAPRPRRARRCELGWMSLHELALGAGRGARPWRGSTARPR